MDDRTTNDVIKSKPVEPALKPVDKMPPQRKSKIGLRLGQLLLLAAVAGAAWFVYYRSEHQSTTRRGGRGGEAASVVVSPVTTGNVDITLNALGTVTSLATVTIKSQISGYLVNVAYTEGQTVKKGDLLAEIDDRPYKLALQNAQGALARDQAMLVAHEADYRRYQELVKTNSIPRQQLDQQKALVDQDNANILSDNAQIATQQLNITYCHIAAPVNGKVGLRLIDQGNYVTPGDASGLVVITQFQPITVIFPVAEDDLPRIKARMAAAGTLPVTALDRSGSKKIGAGELRTIDNQIDTTTGTVRLRAEFANGDEALFPNQFVNVKLLLDTIKGATIVPSGSVQRGPNGPFVYVLNLNKGDPDKGPTVTLKLVKLGPEDGDNVAVTDGLSPGDQVVTQGIDRLSGDGASVVAHDNTGAIIAGANPPPGAGGDHREGGKEGGKNGRHRRGDGQQ